MTDLDTKFLIALAISLTWLVCLIICVLKGKYGMAIVGFVAAVAQEIGLPPIGGYYILNPIYPLWLLPIYGAMRLAHPKSYYAYWFYRRNPAKYFRAAQRFGLEAEYADLVARQVNELTDDERKHIESMQPELYKKGDIISNKYEVHRLLGKGGFGVVYLVSNRVKNSMCALKTFRDELLADAAAREAFKKEALLWVNLDSHPFILAANWIEEFNDRLFVEMDYVAPNASGQVSLADHLVRAGSPLDTAQMLKWAGSQVWRSDGENIGFSLVKSEGNLRCGTPGYMPPELYRGEGADIRTDIYSFGLVLWQMATGSSFPPFVVPYRGDLEGYLRNIYDQQMAGRVPRVDSFLWPAIERCLRPKPAKRCWAEARCASPESGPNRKAFLTAVSAKVRRPGVWSSPKR
jgi:hypothetical protein